MLQWKECIQVQSTNLGPVLEPQYQPTYLEEGTKQTSESWSDVCSFLGVVGKRATIRLIAYEALLNSSQPKGFNLRNKIDSAERWVRIILDKAVFIDGFFKQLDNPKRKIGVGRIRKLDLVVAKGTIALRSNDRIPASSANLFGLELDIFYGSYGKNTEDEYVSISHKKLESWSDSTTKIIRGNDERIQQLTSITVLS
jgi:hypothetical protein